MVSMRHIPALIVILTTTIGGLWPMFDARGAMLEFGFPASIAESKLAAPVMVHAESRTTILGLVTLIFYLRHQYAVVDTILAIYGGYAGAVDTYQVWTLAGSARWAMFRLGASWALAGCGLAGLTASAL
ncbi:hypothetical protein V8F20_001529 [Naviculisporaceae sp. PSN 640]